jgi:trimethylamine--corrinoid protein Co-methyltransferase
VLVETDPISGATAPVLYTNAPTVMDMRTGDVSEGCPERSLYYIYCALLAGCNLNYDAAGAINGVLTTSLEGIAADDELYGYMRRILRGVDFSPETVRGSMEVLTRVAHTGKSFLTERHTKENLRREHWVPTVMDRRRYEVYEQTSRLGMLDFAREKAKKILAEHRPVPLPEPAVKKIGEIVARATG